MAIVFWLSFGMKKQGKIFFWSTEFFCWVEFNLKFDLIFHFREFTSACDKKFCHRDFVLKYVVIGEKKDFQVESGLFRDLFWSRSGLFIAICTKIQNCLK